MAVSLDPLKKAFAPVLRLIKREPVARDAFGGDDLFDGDGDEKSTKMGPKIALAASGALFLVLMGMLTAMLMTGDEAPPPPPAGSLAGLTMEEGDEAAGDATAATDRSAERRPWLVPTQGGGRRLGMPDSVVEKPAEIAAVKPEIAAPAAGSMKDVPVAAAPPKVEPPKPVEAPKVEPPKPADVAKAEPPKTEPPKAPETTVAATPAPAPAAATPKAAVTPPVAPGPTKPAKVAEAASVLSSGAGSAPEPEEEKIPSLLAPAESVPGAPRRFALSSDQDQGPDVAGGRPRLNEPRVPPTEKTAIAAPPPRYANLTEIKGEQKPAPVTGAKVAVVIEGLGLSQSATEAAITRLPPGVTLAFSPYARDLKRWLDRAKARGHEVLIEVPMESKAFPAEDPGPLGLLTVLDSKDNADRLDAILKEASGVAGIFDSKGSKFRESESHVNEVFTKLKEKNLFYVQGRPGIRVGEATVPTATADVLIDERPFRAALDARLDFAERLAKYQGSSVAVMSAKPVSYERLALWIEQLPKKGVSLAPVSGVLIQ